MTDDEMRQRLINALARLETAEIKIRDLEQSRALTEADKMHFRQVVGEIGKLTTSVQIHIATDDQRVSDMRTDIIDMMDTVQEIARLKVAIYSMAAFLAGLGIFNVWAVLA